LVRSSMNWPTWRSSFLSSSLLSLDFDIVNQMALSIQRLQISDVRKSVISLQRLDIN
jgi:hypothetical protein